MSLVLVCATKVSQNYFARSTLLGRSLQCFPECFRPGLALLHSNQGEGVEGLSSFYNKAIESLPDDTTLVFVHDDVYIHDWCLSRRLQEAFEHFDVVGVVGSSNVPYGQPGWWHSIDANGAPVRTDSVQRSGVINHFDPTAVRPDFYGATPQPCDLLDGVFLAIRKQTLLDTGVRFDPRFRFHCYDSDFCYSARRAGLRLGTWPIALTHGSPGSFGQGWVAAAFQLIDKLRQMSELPSAC